MCLSVILFTEGIWPIVCWDTPPSQRQASPSPWTRHPPGQGTPLHSACWEIQATSGQYASYWNAILSTNSFTNAAFIEMTHCKAGTRESHQHGWGNFVETALTLGSLFLSWIDSSLQELICWHLAHPFPMWASTWMEGINVLILAKGYIQETRSWHNTVKRVIWPTYQHNFFIDLQK